MQAAPYSREREKDEVGKRIRLRCKIGPAEQTRIHKFSEGRAGEVYEVIVQTPQLCYNPAVKGKSGHPSSGGTAGSAGQAPLCHVNVTASVAFSFRVA